MAFRISSGTNWADPNTWANVSGGTPGSAGTPTAADAANYDGATPPGTVTVLSAANCLDLNIASPSTGTITIAGSASLAIAGSLAITSSAGVVISGTSNVSFTSAAAKNIQTSGISLAWNVIFNGTGSWALQDNLTTTNGATLTKGTVNLNSHDLTAVTFTSNNGNTRALQFGTGSIKLSGNSATVLSMGILTGFSYTGTPTINLTAAAGSGVRTLNYGDGFGGPYYSEANSLNVKVSAGSDTITTSDTTDSSGFKSIDFTGFTGTFTNNKRTLYGDLKFVAGMTLSAGTKVTTFANTSGTANFTTAGLTVNFPITQNGAGGTVSLADNCTLGATRDYTLTAGALATNDHGLTARAFLSNNANARSTDAGATGNGMITVTGNAMTVIDMGTVTGYSWGANGPPTLISNYSGLTGTRAIALGAASAGASQIILITAGTDTVSITGSAFLVDFTGFGGILANNAIKIYNNLTLSAGMTLTSGANAITSAPAGTSTATWTSNGNTIDCPAILNGATTATLALGDNLTLGATRALTITSGKIKDNGHSVTCGNVVVSGGTTRQITFGTGPVWLLKGTGTVWDASGTGLTITKGTGTIQTDDATAATKTVNGGGKAYATLYFSGAGTGIYEILGSNTFDSIQMDAGALHTLQLEHGKTQTLTAATGFVIDGDATHQNTLQSDLAGNAATISVASGTINLHYVTLKDQTATGGATFLALVGNGCIDGGGNTGWIFAAGPVVNLTGVSAGAAVGSISTTSDVSLQGVSGTGQVNTTPIQADASPAVSGVSAMAEAGTTEAVQGPEVMGVSGTASVNGLGLNDTFAIDGSAASAVVNQTGISDGISISGVTATGNVNSLTPSAAQTLSGVSADAVANPVTMSSVVDVSISGVSSAAAVGPIATTISPAIDGVSAAGEVSDIMFSNTFQASGVFAHAVVGSINIMRTSTVPIVGVFATAVIGQVIVQSITPEAGFIVAAQNTQFIVAAPSQQFIVASR